MQNDQKGLRPSPRRLQLEYPAPTAAASMSGVPIAVRKSPIVRFPGSTTRSGPSLARAPSQG